MCVAALSTITLRKFLRTNWVARGALEAIPLARQNEPIGIRMRHLLKGAHVSTTY